MKTLLFILLFTTVSFSQIDDDIIGGPSYESMPIIKGGLDSLHLGLIYPEKAKRLGIQGRVYLIVDIDSLGNIDSVSVLKGIGYGCNEEAVRLIKTAIFTPGYMPKVVGIDSAGKKIIRSVPYKCKLTIPIRFKL